MKVVLYPLIFHEIINRFERKLRNKCKIAIINRWPSNTAVYISYFLASHLQYIWIRYCLFKVLLNTKMQNQNLTGGQMHEEIV